jgi:hypothetical protein
MSIREDLKAYVDGELDAARAAEVRAALESDPQLREEAEQLKLLSQEIRQFAAEPQVFGLERTLLALRPRRPWWRSPARLSFAGVAGALAVLTIAGGVDYAMPWSAQESTRSGQLYMASDQAREAPATFGAAVESADVDARAEKKSETQGVAKAGAGGAGGVNEDVKLSQPDRERGNHSRRGTTITGGGFLDLAELKQSPQAQLTVQVEDPTRVDASVDEIAQDLNGVVQSNVVLAGPPASKKVVLRVPAESFEEAVKRLSNIEASANVVFSNVVRGAEADVDVDAGGKSATDKAPPLLGDFAEGETADSFRATKDKSSRQMPATQVPADTALRYQNNRRNSMVTVMATFEHHDERSPDARTLRARHPRYGFMDVAGLVFRYSPIWIPVLLAVWWFGRRYLPD